MTTHCTNVDAIEIEFGHAINRQKLEEAARILACPLKPNPPCWQHGRVLYAVLRNYLDKLDVDAQKPCLLDIGTAKGFSALVMAWAAKDAGWEIAISSVDMLDPQSTEPRNSVLDLQIAGPTIEDYMAPWATDAKEIRFYGGGSKAFLDGLTGRINFAFVDGKHSTEAVEEDGMFVAARQHAGDIILFDDLQMIPVRQGVGRLKGYTIRLLHASKERQYALAVKI